VTGEFWSGKPLGFEGRVLRLDHAHKVVTGLHDGSADLIGWTRVVITTEMVGSTIAQFTSGEVKVKGHGRIATDQQTWHDAVIAAGGRAGFLWSVEDARRLVALT
jgi:hypothetical protein